MWETPDYRKQAGSINEEQGQEQAQPIYSAPAPYCSKERGRAAAQLLISEEKPVIQSLCQLSWFLNTDRIKTSKDRSDPSTSSLWMSNLEQSLKLETEGPQLP